MGINDISRGAARFAEVNSGYVEFAREMAEQNSTPIFEWCSRQQRIVIDHPIDRLVLTAVRDNQTGEYMSYSAMQEIATNYNVEVVKAFAGFTSNIAALMEQTRVLKDAEGYVIRFDNGHMLKLKSEEYLLFHKVKDNLTMEKNVVAMMVNEKVDDLKAFMLAEDREHVEQFETAFWTGLNETVKEYERFYAERVVAGNIDRKRFALEMLPNAKKTDPFIHVMVFGQFEGHNVRNMVLDLVRKNLSTQNKVDHVRRLWKNAKWNYHFNGDI
jgi:RNA ligase